MLTKIDSNDKQLLRNLIPLTTLSESKFNALSANIQIESSAKGVALFRQGDTDNEFVYLLSGKVSLQAGETEMDVIEGGTETSRFALAHQIPRKINAVAKSKIRFVRIDSKLLYSSEKEQQTGSGYQVAELPEEASDDWMTTLLKSPIFQRLPASNLQKIIIELEEIELEKDSHVVRQGDAGDYYYIIKNGRCVLTRKPTPNAKEIRLAQLKSCDTFGEDALISGNPRNVSISMLTPGILLRLKKDKFLKLIKEPIIDYLDFPAIKKEMEAGAKLIDIRSPDEFEKYHIEGSQNVPFFSLRMQLHSFDINQRVFLVCDNGNSSEAAAFLLIRHKLDAVVLRGGLKNVPDKVLNKKALDGLVEKSEVVPENLNKVAEISECSVTSDQSKLDADAESDLFVIDETIRSDIESVSKKAEKTNTATENTEKTDLRDTESVDVDLQLNPKLDREEHSQLNLENLTGLAKDEDDGFSQITGKASDSMSTANKLDSHFQGCTTGEANSESRNDLYEEIRNESNLNTGVNESYKKRVVEPGPIGNRNSVFAERTDPVDSIDEELKELKREKELAEKQIVHLKHQNEELKAVVQEFVDSNSGQSANEEITSLQAELEMIRTQAASDVSAMKQQLKKEQESVLKLNTELAQEKKKVVQLESGLKESMNINTDLTPTDEDIFSSDVEPMTNRNGAPKTKSRPVIYMSIFSLIFIISAFSLVFGTEYGKRMLASYLQDHPSNGQFAPTDKQVRAPIIKKVTTNMGITPNPNIENRFENNKNAGSTLVESEFESGSDELGVDSELFDDAEEQLLVKSVD